MHSDWPPFSRFCHSTFNLSSCHLLRRCMQTSSDAHILNITQTSNKMDQSRMTSLPAARSGMHSSRRLSSNGSLSELGLLEHSQPQEQQQRRSSSGGRSINSSSSKSSTISSSPSSNINMMKKLGSKFTLKRNRDGSTSTSTSTDDAVEELADEDQVLATARPRNGRILTSSTASNASRQSGVYGDLTQVSSLFDAKLDTVNKDKHEPFLLWQSDTGVNRLRHRTSISNLVSVQSFMYIIVLLAHRVRHSSRTHLSIQMQASRVLVAIQACKDSRDNFVTERAYQVL